MKSISRIFFQNVFLQSLIMYSFIIITVHKGWQPLLFLSMTLYLNRLKIVPSQNCTYASYYHLSHHIAVEQVKFYLRVSGKQNYMALFHFHFL